jgi:hypothetical protein
LRTAFTRRFAQLWDVWLVEQLFPATLLNVPNFVRTTKPYDVR